MSQLDSAWLRMDRDANLMTIVGVWQLATGINIAAVRERIASSLLYPERQRIVDGLVPEFAKLSTVKLCCPGVNKSRYFGDVYVFLEVF